MTPEIFPPHVSEFIKNIGICLEQFDLHLSPMEEEPEVLFKSFSIVGSQLKTTLSIHRALQSHDQEVANYRAKVWAEVPDEYASLLNGKDAQFNRVATLGALVSGETGASICSQCLIDPKDPFNLAGVLSASIAQAGLSLIHSVGKVLNPEAIENDAVHELSAWGDLDIEQIQYDHGHFGSGSHTKNSWTTFLNLRHKLTLTAVQNNPYYGGGLLSLLHVPREEFGEKNTLSIRNANNLEYTFGKAPTFGAWCDNDEHYVFTSFFPNYLKNLPGLSDSVINWAMTRSQTVGRLVQISEEILETE